MRKALAAGALALVAATAACGTGTVVQTQSTYCVNNAGQVVDPQYCDPTYAGYTPGLYDFWIGYTAGHMFRPGMTITHNYYISGKSVNPTDKSARVKAGLPATGRVGNSTRVGGTPAKPQTGSSRVGSSSRPGNTGRTNTRSGGFGSSTSRSGGFSSGGRK